MEIPPIPQDDIIDVVELTDKIETYISDVLTHNELNIAMSALMSASVNSMLMQCETLDEVLFYRNFFIQILDNSIRSIRIEGSEPLPPSE